MSRRINIENERFGRLIAKEYTGDYKWKCVCDCGNVAYVRSNALRSGKTKSCGCYNRDVAKKNMTKTMGKGDKNIHYIKDRKIAAFNSVIASYKLNAKYRGVQFSLSNKEIYSLLEGNCYYCGVEPSNEKKVKVTSEKISYNGIDRINNKIGYINGNVVSCCITCNRAKNKMGLNDFLSWVKSVYLTMEGK